MTGAGGSPTHILVVQSGFLGDVVLTTPLLAAVRRRFPRATLAMLVTPAAAALVAHHPALDVVMVDDKRGRARGLVGFVALVRAVRAQRFSIALAAHKSFRTALLLRAAGVPRRIGFANAPGAALYTERVPRPLECHDRDRLLQLLTPFAAVGSPIGREARPWVALDAGTRVRAAALLERAGVDGRPVAAICPASIWPTKRWPARSYGRLVERLEDDGYRCILLGASTERPITAAVQAAAGGRGVDLAGKTDLGLLAAVLARAAVVVTNDSAPMHLAGAVAVPQVAIFCATTPAQGYGPLGERAVVVEKNLACRPCGRHGGVRCPRGTYDCMELIEVDEVYAAIARARAA